MRRVQGGMEAVARHRVEGAAIGFAVRRASVFVNDGRGLANQLRVLRGQIRQDAVAVDRVALIVGVGARDMGERGEGVNDVSNGRAVKHDWLPCWVEG